MGIVKAQCFIEKILLHYKVDPCLEGGLKRDASIWAGRHKGVEKDKRKGCQACNTDDQHGRAHQQPSASGFLTLGHVSSLRASQQKTTSLTRYRCLHNLVCQYLGRVFTDRDINQGTCSELVCIISAVLLSDYKVFTAI